MSGKLCTLRLFFIAIICPILVFIIIFYFLFFLFQDPKLIFTNATLSQFSFIKTTNSLQYNIALNTMIINPNRMLDIYYSHIQAIVSFRKQRFAMMDLTSAPFYQGHKNVTLLRPAFLEGQQLVVFGEREISEFNSETAAGIHSIDVQLALWLSLRFGKLSINTSHNFPIYLPSRKHYCKLKVPLTTFNQTSRRSFQDYHVRDFLCVPPTVL